MSDYIQQNFTYTNFNNSENRLLLSNIEDQIKKKIEAIGIPLSEFNISINYGIKTGLNEAFIIDENIKNRLINEDPKSAELIKPLLRGRDIRRFGYEYKNVYLICTFPSRKININDYKAIKNYFLSFGKEKLEQSGQILEKNGVKIVSRKKTCNKRYETQDSICYMDDFSKQKLVWTPVNSQYRFALIPPDIYFNNSIFMIVGSNLELLCGLANSQLFQFYFNFSLSSGEYNYGSANFFKNVPFCNADNNFTAKIKEIVTKIGIDTDQKYIEIYIKELDAVIYELYKINDNEQKYIISYLQKN